MKRWPNVVCPASMPSTENFTTSGSSVSRPKVAVIACSGRTQDSEPDLAERSPEHIDGVAAGLFDQRDVEIALLGIGLNLGVLDPGQTGRLQESLDRRIGAAD